MSQAAVAQFYLKHVQRIDVISSTILKLFIVMLHGPACRYVKMAGPKIVFALSARELVVPLCSGSVTIITIEVRTNSATTLSCMNSSGYAGHLVACSILRAVYRVMVRIRIRIRFSVWLVSYYAQVFVLRSTVIVTLPFAVWTMHLIFLWSRYANCQ